MQVLPILEKVACACTLLPALLPPNAPRPRPIRCVQLDCALYDENDGKMGFWSTGSQGVPTWEDVVEALRCLPWSAGPVVDLSFCVRWLDAGRCWAVLGEIIRSLQRLVIVIDEGLEEYNAIGDWGETLLTQAPSLHTVLLSDAPLDESDDEDLGFVFAHDKRLQLQWLQRWDNHPNALKTVAFTSKFVWRKGGNGWEASPRWDSEDSEG
ncbi:hypothetical protein OH77DRAFT_1518816 [Trametes cingulata]|nr:hypothetical protein OH77DRAFT_1518816 [Trametes cingulata]